MHLKTFQNWAYAPSLSAPRVLVALPAAAASGLPPTAKSRGPKKSSAPGVSALSCIVSLLYTNVFGPSVWFSVSEGRNQNASPRHMLPMICKAGNLTKDDIGAIRIAEDVTYFEISKASVDRFLTSIGPEMKIEETKDLVRLDKAPDLSSTGRPGLDRKFKGRPSGQKRDAAPAERKAPRRQPKPEAQSAKTVRTTESLGTSDDETKSKFKASGAKPKKRKAGSVEQKSGRSKPDGDAPKGPPPPKGKPSSKKNRARAAATKSAKGGNAVPKRRKPGPKVS